MNPFTKPLSIKTFLLIAALLAVVHPANAHPGHDLLDQGAVHVITSSYHLVMLAATGVAVIAVAQIVRSRPAQQWLRIAGVGAVIAAGLLGALVN